MVGAGPHGGGLLEAAAGYLFHRAGCANPFRISRMLVLAAWRGLPLLDEMRVEGEPYGFSIPEVALAIQRWISSGCAERDEANKCVRYLCARPDLPDVERSILDSVYEEVKDLPDVELNRRVIRDPRYRGLIGR